LGKVIFIRTLIFKQHLNSLLRPVIAEKTVYEPTCPQEQFIVPLLRRHIEDFLTKYAVPAPVNGRVLDVGCGGQPFRETLEKMGYKYISLDVQQNPKKTVDIVCAIDEPLPQELLKYGYFDFVLCTEVLEHVADWIVVFENLKKLMSKRGRLLITCPHFYQLHEEPFDFWRPTIHALRYFASRVDLRILEEDKAGNAWDVLGTLLANSNPISVNRSFVTRGMAKLMRFILQQIFRLLCAGTIQKHIILDSPLYLSNIIILEHENI